MPYVNVRVTRDGITARQKAQIVAEIQDAAVTPTIGAPQRPTGRGCTFQ
ncbi:MAG: tautomerase family protein [Limisphaerales bacterium]